MLCEHKIKKSLSFLSLCLNYNEPGKKKKSSLQIHNSLMQSRKIMNSLSVYVSK